MDSLFNKMRYAGNILAGDATTVVLSDVAMGIEELDGRELKDAQNLNNRTNVRFTVRHNVLIASSCFVQFEGALYPVDYVRDPGVPKPKPGEVRRHTLMELYAHRNQDGV